MVLESGSAALSGGMSAEAVVRVSSANARTVDEEGSSIREWGLEEGKR